MPMNPAHLMKRLEPPVRPGAAGSTGKAPTSPLEQQSFDQLMTLVARGDVRSDRAVRVDFATDDELTPEQLDRLAGAADQAQAHGARRAVMLIDGRGLVMDVAERALTAELSAADSGAVMDIDAAVYVPGEEEGSASRGRLKLPSPGVIPPAITEQFQQADRMRSSGGNEQDNGPGAGDRSVA